jgi:HPt (histidine-containing phosphotransfer) domain-containing protein
MPAVTPQGETDDVKSLDLAGVDAVAGLRLTGGKMARYETLLRKFAERQDGAVTDIRMALSRGDAATAERAAHSLKGSAATLGAASLAEAAAGAEIALRTGNGVEEALIALSLALDPVIGSIQAALPEEAPGNGKDQAPGDPGTVVEPLARLKRLLESDDGEAADFIIDAKSQLAGVLTPAEVKKLSDQVGNFEFEAALKCLSGIASRLSLDLEGK